MKKKIPAVLETRGEEAGEIDEIYSASPHWNTRLTVPLVTSLFERGLCRCLVSTRSLLGEGWNSVTLNTLIDLTAITSYAFVNQIRGRTLRLDDKRPFKMANNWDVATIVDDPDHGGHDLDRLRKKYTRFYGISIDGVIEKGIGHAHPLLSRRDMESVYPFRASFNAEMLHRAQSRLEWYKKWNIGKPYKNRPLSCIEIEFPAAEPAAFPLIAPDRFYERMLKKAGAFNKLRFLPPFLLLIALVYSPIPSLFMPLLVVIALFALFVFLSKSKNWLPRPLVNFFMERNFQKERDPEKTLRLLARIILRMLRKIHSGLDVSMVRREDGSLRVFCTGETVPGDFAPALSEMLSPLGNQHTQEPAAQGRQSSGVCCSGKVFDSGYTPLNTRQAAGYVPFANNQKYFLLIEGAENFDFDFLKDLYKKFSHTKIPEKNIFSKYIRKFEGSEKGSQNRLSLAFPVPALFSKTRGDAENFRDLWEKETGGGRLIGPRSADRGAVISTLSRLKALPLTFSLRELWE